MIDQMEEPVDMEEPQQRLPGRSQCQHAKQTYPGKFALYHARPSRAMPNVEEPGRIMISCLIGCTRDKSARRSKSGEKQFQSTHQKQALPGARDFFGLITNTGSRPCQAQVSYAAAAAQDVLWRDSTNQKQVAGAGISRRGSGAYFFVGFDIPEADRQAEASLAATAAKNMC